MGRGKKTDSREINKKIVLIKKLLTSDTGKSDAEVFRTFLTTDGRISSQEDIIRSLLAGKDTFSILPTGKGKSLCFQMAAMFSPGLTVVITPLVALIADQVHAFNEKYNEKAVKKALGASVPVPRAVNPGTGRMTIRRLLDDISDCQQHSHGYEYKLLYVSPERLSNEKFRRIFAEYNDPESPKYIHISNIIIDEVHCMSQWGFDFRESYLRIPEFLSMLPNRPVIGAFTATATPMDIRDICAVLGLSQPQAEIERGKRECNFIVCYEERTNLHLHVIECSSPSANPLKSACATKSIKPGRIYQRLTQVRYLLKGNAGKPCIIYCLTVTQVKKLYEQLKAMEDDSFNPVMYHAQMPRTERERNAQLFESGSSNILIATLAYGMGIDVRNISMIIHYDVPESLEEYYQEVGRAGRDNNCEADCYLMYTKSPCCETDEACDRTSLMNGTYIHNLKWYIEEMNSYSLETMPIASRFSDEIKIRMQCTRLLRLAMVWWYCDSYKSVDTLKEKTSTACRQPQDMILSFLKGTIDIEDAVKSFLLFLKNNMQPEDYDFLSKIIHMNPQWFCNSLSTDSAKEMSLLQNGVLKVLKEVNELHINNCAIANMIRWHPEKIEYNSLNHINIKEWRKACIPPLSIRSTLMLTDVRETTVLLSITSDSDSMDKYYDVNFIQTLWDESTNKPENAVILLVADKNNRVRAVYRRSNPAWIKGSQNDIDTFILRNISELIPWNIMKDWRTAVDKHDRDMYFYTVTGQRQRTVSFELSGGQPVDYFDMCILDAIYSIIINRKPIIYVKTIWEVLSGNPDVHFSRADSRIQTRIEEGIDRLCRTTIRIEDENLQPADGSHQLCGAMLNIRRREGGERGYSYSPGYVPTLFKYAENINGEIIKIPVNLLNYSRLESISKPKAAKKGATIENAVLSHYVLHRRAIARNSHRGSHIKPETLQRIVSPYTSKSTDISSILDKYNTFTKALEIIEA